MFRRINENISVEDYEPIFNKIEHRLVKNLRMNQLKLQRHQIPEQCKYQKSKTSDSH